MVFEKTGKCAPSVLIAGFVALIVVVIVGWVAVPLVIDNLIKKEARLEEGSTTWDKWKDIPVPIYFKIHVLHVTNPDEVENGAKPIFEQKGPYSYREERYKVNITIDGDLISYRQVMFYHFDLAESSGPDTETVNIINIPFVSAAYMAHQILGPAGASLVVYVVQYFAKGKESIIQRGVSVRDFVFDGLDVSAYTTPLQMLQDIFPYLPIMSILPKQFVGDKFGLYIGRNGTDVGEYTIYSGVEDYKLFGEIYAIDGHQQLSFWSGEKCNAIDGTDTTIFHSRFEKDEPIKIFHTDMCRSFAGFFERESEYKDIPAYHFIVPESLLEDPRVSEDNRCFCPEDKVGDLGVCLKKGAIRLSTCYGGAPIVMSLPNFLYGDSQYQDDTGLTPSRDKHDTFVDMEPNTGMVLRGFLRAQLNLELIAWPTVPYFKQVRPMIFPFMWIEESANLHDELVDDLKKRFLRPVRIVTIVKWTLLGLSSALTVFGIGFVVYRLRQS